MTVIPNYTIDDKVLKFQILITITRCLCRSDQIRCLAFYSCLSNNFRVLFVDKTPHYNRKKMAHSRSLHEVTAKNEATPPQSPAPLASAVTGTKRSRDDAEDDKNEDSFYGRRPAKSRSKTAKNLEQNKKSIHECLCSFTLFPQRS